MISDISYMNARSLGCLCIKAKPQAVQEQLGRRPRQQNPLKQTSQSLNLHSSRIEEQNMVHRLLHLIAWA